jgi:YfiH family protein
MTLFEWAAPGPYRVAFSSRLGGVSTGAFESLNLGALTEDDPENVRENRRRLCAEVGVDPETATMAWQYHSADVVRADGRGVVTPGLDFERCDGLWTDEPGRGLMLLSADCLPVALARTDGEPAVAALHVGWKGLLAGIVESGAAALGGEPFAAAIGPGVGPCCYEVGDEVAGPFRERFGDDVMTGRNLDLAEAAERALRAAGAESVERVGLCTSCEEDLFFSHRRDRGRTGRQGIVAALR